MVASVAAAAYRWWQRGLGQAGGGGGGAGRRSPIGGPQSPSALRAAEPEPEPEAELVSAVAAPSSRAALTSEGALEDRQWVAPLDGGSCPAGHPVKANSNSGIYHVPGGRFYDRIEADRCYASPDAAATAGYRPAKV